METNHQDTGQETAGQPTEPAHSAARQQQRADRLFAKVLGDPQQLRASQSAKYTGYSRVNCMIAVREAVAPEFALEDPKPDERAYGDEDAETRDLELTDAKEDWIDRALASSLIAPAAAPGSTCASGESSSRPPS